MSKWISVKERLPKVDSKSGISDFVLVSIVYETEDEQIKKDTSMMCYHINFGWITLICDVEVVAWQPMPEPYDETAALNKRNDYLDSLFKQFKEDFYL